MGPKQKLQHDFYFSCPLESVKILELFIALKVRCSNRAFSNMSMNKTVHDNDTDSTVCHQIAEMHSVPMRILPTAPSSLS